MSNFNGCQDLNGSKPGGVWEWADLQVASMVCLEEFPRVALHGIPQVRGLGTTECLANENNRLCPFQHLE